MRPRNWIVLGLLSFFAFVPMAGCQAEPYQPPEPVVSNSPFDESRLYEYKRSCDSQLSAFDERLNLVTKMTDDLYAGVHNLQTRVGDIENKLKLRDDLEANQVPTIKPNSPVAKGKTYETEVLGWLKSNDTPSTGTVSNCPGGKCPINNCPDGNCPTSNCPDGKCPLQTVAEVGPDTKPGHWTYPGSIDSHLKETHGVNASGLTHEQKLTLHDQLHESAKSKPVPVQSVSTPVYQSVATQSTCPRGGCPPAQQTYQIRGRWFRR
ncbi:MAG: hypothetical protein ACK506_16235 [Pirellula sp.]